MHAIKDAITTEAEYLAGEPLSEIRHEYLGGQIYAKAGASERHNIISMNLYRALGKQLRGKDCQPFGSDMKLRLRPLGDIYYYYPDAMIACDPTDSGNGWRERPSVLFEIISEDTRRVDMREKRLAYQLIPSLEAYVRIEQKEIAAEVERKTPQGWKIENLAGAEAIISLPTIGIEIPLAELYERLTF